MIAISSLAGIRDQSIRKMKWLFSRLCSPKLPPIPYPFTPLPEQHAGEEVEDLISDALVMMPYLRHPDCTELAYRCLMLLHKVYPHTPQRLLRTKEQLISIVKLYVPGFDPTPEPNLHAQFIEHKSLIEQLTPDAEARYRMGRQASSGAVQRQTRWQRLMLTLDEARDLLANRRYARKTGDQRQVHSIDKAISHAVQTGNWPPNLQQQARAKKPPASSPRPRPKPSMRVGGPGSKWEEWEGPPARASNQQIKS